MNIIPWITAAALIAAERAPELAQGQVRKTVWQRIGRNAALGGIQRLLSTPLFLAPLLLAAANIHLWNRSEVLGSNQLIFIAMLILDFLVLDLVNYLLHVACHKIPLLWRFHRVHHMDEDPDASTGLRVHFGEKILTVPFKLAVVALLAMPLSSIAVYEVCVGIFGIFHHTRLRLPSWFDDGLGLIFSMPGFHLVHHHDRAQYTDSNYGFVLSIWDALFETISVRRPVDGEKFGLDTGPEKPFMVLLLSPFRDLFSSVGAMIRVLKKREKIHI
jgi:sterol desaturase/sphingolipid hydroxylase (fatty acid hydroxylase superfamily)